MLETMDGPSQDERALLEAVAADLDDDTPRLVYADWLDEYRPDLPQTQAANSTAWEANEREGLEPSPSTLATFIRIQVEAARLPKWNHRRSQLERQAKRLIQEHKEEWNRPFSAFRSVIIQYSRGFPHTVLVYSNDFLEKGEELFKRHPTIVGAEIYYFPDPGSCTQDFVQSSLIAYLQELSIRGGNLGAVGVEALTSSPYLGHLKILDLTSERIGDTGVVALAKSENLAKLQELILRNNALTASAATALARSPNLANLRSLVLDENRIGPTGRFSLASSETLSHLQYLRLDDEVDFVRAARRARADPRLADKPLLPGLIELNGRPIQLAIERLTFSQKNHICLV